MIIIFVVLRNRTGLSPMDQGGKYPMMENGVTAYKDQGHTTFALHRPVK